MQEAAFPLQVYPVMQLMGTGLPLNMTLLYYPYGIILPCFKFKFNEPNKLKRHYMGVLAFYIFQIHLSSFISPYANG